MEECSSPDHAPIPLPMICAEQDWIIPMTDVEVARRNAGCRRRPAGHSSRMEAARRERPHEFVEGATDAGAEGNGGRAHPGEGLPGRDRARRTGVAREGRPRAA